MKTAWAISGLLAGLLGFLFLARAADEQRPSVSVPASDAMPPVSLTGSWVQVSFRRADDISPNISGNGTPALPGSLSHLKGRVLRVSPGWIELERRDQPGATACWIPTSSVAFVSLAEDGPATRP